MGGIKEQATQCFKNIQSILESTDHVMHDIVRITLFKVDPFIKTKGVGF